MAKKKQVKKSRLAGSSKKTNLKDFLSELAINPEKLGRFIHNPEETMKTAQLDEQDQAALVSGFAGMIYARLAGVSLEKAFRVAPSQTPPAFQYPNVYIQKVFPVIHPVIHPGPHAPWIQKAPPVIHPVIHPGPYGWYQGMSFPWTQQFLQYHPMLYPPLFHYSYPYW